MGMPACTITSQTAHGGIVIVGYPTVLIGEMPASRIGDMHTCPMFDGPVPHVGGPLILGSPTVLVGDMPQSRVTDTLTCVGPPDTVIKGCETVLVGMAGGGGAAGAAGGAAAMGVAVPTQSPSSSSSTTSELQYDGTMRTSTTGDRLPPITLQQKGWPSLPPSATQSFQSVQPVTTPDGTKAWMGTAAATGAPQVWVPPPPPALPSCLVGVQDGKSGVRGNRHNSGPLAPEFGGTGDPTKDFEVLGGTNHQPAPAGSTYKPGTRISANGVTLRPSQDGNGPRIDIPANGSKPHETLHYPERGQGQ